jgi:hypothetical protein
VWVATAGWCRCEKKPQLENEAAVKGQISTDSSFCSHLICRACGYACCTDMAVVGARRTTAWHFAVSDAIRYCLFSRQLQLASQIVFAVIVTALFTLLQPMQFAHACLSAVFAVVILSSLAGDQHVGTLLNVCSLFMGPSWIAALLAGALMLLAKLAEPAGGGFSAAYTAAAALLGQFGLLLLIAGRLAGGARGGAPRMMASLASVVYGVIVLVSLSTPGAAAFALYGVGCILAAFLLATGVSIAAALLVSPSLASDEVVQLTVRVLRGTGQLLSYHTGQLMAESNELQQQHKQQPPQQPSSHHLYSCASMLPRRQQDVGKPVALQGNSESSMPERSSFNSNSMPAALPGLADSNGMPNGTHWRPKKPTAAAAAATATATAALSSLARADAIALQLPPRHRPANLLLRGARSEADANVRRALHQEHHHHHQQQQQQEQQQQEQQEQQQQEQQMTVGLLQNDSFTAAEEHNNPQQQQLLQQPEHQQADKPPEVVQGVLPASITAGVTQGSDHATSSSSSTRSTRNSSSSVFNGSNLISQNDDDGSDTGRGPLPSLSAALDAAAAQPESSSPTDALNPELLVHPAFQRIPGATAAWVQGISPASHPPSATPSITDATQDDDDDAAAAAAAADSSHGAQGPGASSAQRLTSATSIEYAEELDDQAFVRSLRVQARTKPFGARSYASLQELAKQQAALMAAVASATTNAARLQPHPHPHPLLPLYMTPQQEQQQQQQQQEQQQQQQQQPQQQSPLLGSLLGSSQHGSTRPPSLRSWVLRAAKQQQQDKQKPEQADSVDNGGLAPSVSNSGPSGLLLPAAAGPVSGPPAPPHPVAVAVGGPGPPVAASQLMALLSRARALLKSASVEPPCLRPAPLCAFDTTAWATLLDDAELLLVRCVPHPCVCNSAWHVRCVQHNCTARCVQYNGVVLLSVHLVNVLLCAVCGAIVLCAVCGIWHHTVCVVPCSRWSPKSQPVT